MSINDPSPHPKKRSVGAAKSKRGTAKRTSDAPASSARPMTAIVAKANRQQVQAATASKSPKPKPKSRANKKGLVLYVEPEVTVALRRLALDTGLSVQVLGMDGLNLLFEKHGVATFNAND